MVPRPDCLEVMRMDEFDAAFAERIRQTWDEADERLDSGLTSDDGGLTWRPMTRDEIINTGWAEEEGDEDADDADGSGDE